MRTRNDFRHLFGFGAYSVYNGATRQPLANQPDMPQSSPSSATASLHTPSNRPSASTGPTGRLMHNRVAAVMLHVPWYTISGQARLARDAGVSKSAISRLLSGQSAPGYLLANAVTAALERRMGRSLHPRDLFSPDGTYPTASVCDLCGCRGCVPGQAYDESSDTLRPQFRHLRAGEWDLSVQAHGAAPRLQGKQSSKAGGPMT